MGIDYGAGNGAGRFRILSFLFQSAQEAGEERGERHHISWDYPNLFVGSLIWTLKYPLIISCTYQGNTESNKLIPPSTILTILIQFAGGLTRAANHLLCLQHANTIIAIPPSQIIALRLTSVKKEWGCSQRRSDRGAMGAGECIPRPQVLVIAMRSSWSTTRGWLGAGRLGLRKTRRTSSDIVNLTVSLEQYGCCPDACPYSMRRAQRKLLKTGQSKGHLYAWRSPNLCARSLLLCVQSQRTFHGFNSARIYINLTQICGKMWQTCLLQGLRKILRELSGDLGDEPRNRYAEVWSTWTCFGIFSPTTNWQLYPYKAGMLLTTLPSFFACTLSLSRTDEFAHRSGGVRLLVDQ